MKVYAEFFNEGPLQFRRNTLLQFGHGWNLIGNAVLANPGSAEPISEITNEDLDLISIFYRKFHEDASIQSNNWYVFSPDSTMRFVEKIFNGWYLGRSLKLNGVIQLFNTFNIKNQYLQEAISQVGLETDLLFSYTAYQYFGDKPTYFGFGRDVLKNKRLRKVAMAIFKNSSDRVKSIYRDSFSDNDFYHPGYVNRAYRQPSFQEYKNTILSSIIETQ